MKKDKLSIDINAIIGHDSACERKKFQDLKELTIRKVSRKENNIKKKLREQ